VCGGSKWLRCLSSDWRGSRSIHAEVFLVLIVGEPIVGNLFVEWHLRAMVVLRSKEMNR